MTGLNLNLFDPSVTSSALLQFIASEIAVRGSVLTLLAITLILLVTRSNAGARSLLWLMLIFALALMPLLSTWLPNLPFAISVTTSAANETAHSWSHMAISVLNGKLIDSWSGNIQSLVLSIYLGIACAGIGYLLLGLASLVGITRRSSGADAAEHTAQLKLLEKLRSHNGMDSRISLSFSAETQSPMTWGIWQHHIILPTQAQQWHDDLLAQCLSHELAHIQRMDWASHILSRLVLCLYWFNPLNWWLHQRFLEDSEKACDQSVIEDTGCAITYAENLLWFAQSLSRNSLPQHQRQTCLANGLIKSRSTLYRRVEYILSSHQHYSSNGRTGLSACIVFSALLVAPASALEIRFVEEQIRPPPDPHVFRVSYYPRGTPQHSQLLGQFGQH